MENDNVLAKVKNKRRNNNNMQVDVKGNNSFYICTEKHAPKILSVFILKKRYATKVNVLYFVLMLK